MGVFKEIAKADGSGTTTFYRLSSEEDTVETTSTDGTSTMIDYNSMLNKPSINDVALVGNKTLEDLGIQPAGDYLTAIPEEYITEDELASSDYATKQYVMEQINNIEHFSREVVEALPVTGKSNVIYLKPKDKTNGDVYNEYIWTGADYELIGTTSPDLTIFYTKEETDAKLDKKVTKVEGKDLSSNDYTTAEKTKLASLSNYDDSELRNAVNALHNYDDTEVRQDIATLEDRSTDLETSTNQLETDIVKKTTLVRLIKAGDRWSWQDIEGNNLTFAQAQEMLGHQNTLFVLEDIENDGKFSPLIYISNDDAIAAIFMSDDKKIHMLNGADTPIDSPMGYFVNYAEAVETVEGLNGLGEMDGEIRRVKATDDFYIYDSTDNKWLPFDKGASIDLSNYLSKDNTIPYAPSTDYNPATKRYVDTEIDALFIPTKVSQLNNDSAFVNKTTTTLENYYTKTNTYTKREVDALIDAATSSGGISDYNDLDNQPSVNGVVLTGNKTSADLKVAGVFQYSTMPTPGPSYEYQIVQYTGFNFTQSDQDGNPYEQGHFYICSSYISLDGGSEGWGWKEIRVQDNPDLSNYLSKQNYTEYTPTGDYNPATKKYVDDAIATVEVPTKVSDLTNDAKYITETELNTKLNEASTPSIKCYGMRITWMLEGSVHLKAYTSNPTATGLTYKWTSFSADAEGGVDEVYDTKTTTVPYTSINETVDYNTSGEYITYPSRKYVTFQLEILDSNNNVLDGAIYYYGITGTFAT